MYPEQQPGKEVQKRKSEIKKKGQTRKSKTTSAEEENNDYRPELQTRILERLSFKEERPYAWCGSN